MPPALSNQLSISSREEYVIPCHPKSLKLGTRTHIMGILNITPDSFSDGGEFLNSDSAIKHGLKLIHDGADIIDVGAESTRPGAKPVDSEEELRRLIPVIQGLRQVTDCPISVDTQKANVAAKALKAGANIINDITGFQGDPEMANIASEFQAPSVLMHIRGTPLTMNEDTSYDHLIVEICDYLQKGIDLALKAGLSEDRILIDPGIGFGKGCYQNLELIHRLSEFSCLGKPILVGPSRKSFIGQTLDLLPKDRIFGTAASVALAAWNGAHIIRVHDVREMRQVLDMTDAIRSAHSFA